MMLDKSQISGWDGEPEADEAPAKPAAGKKPPEASAESMLNVHREAVPTGEFVKLTPEQTKARKRRGQWIALALFAFVILLFVLTMTKVGGGQGLPEVYHIPSPSQ